MKNETQEEFWERYCGTHCRTAQWCNQCKKYVMPITKITKNSLCKRCGEFILPKQECNCRKFEIVNPKYDDEVAVWASSPENAAKKYAEAFNEEYGDYQMIQLGNSTLDLMIDGEPYRVDAEPVIEYQAWKT